MTFGLAALSSFAIFHFTPLTVLRHALASSGVPVSPHPGRPILRASIAGMRSRELSQCARSPGLRQTLDQFPFLISNLTLPSARILNNKS